MKYLLKKCLLVMLIISLLVPFLSFEKDFKVSASANTSNVNNANSYTKDLSKLRKNYISKDNVGYTSNTSTTLPFNESLTSLSVGTNNSNGFASFQGSDICINNATNFDIRITFADKIKDSTLYSMSTSERKEQTKIYEKYTLSHDTWGSTKKDKPQTVYANGLHIETGEIGTGALVIQTSKDKDNWVNEKYANGIYTTDVLNYYHGTTQKYCLDGMDIKEGVYVCVNFFYEVKYDYTYYYTTQERYWYQLGFIGGTHTVEHYDKIVEYFNIREAYYFFVIEDNLEVVTFNNLTTADKNEIIEVTKPSSQNPEEFKSQTEQYNNYLNYIFDQISQTMYDGDMTTTGFRINVTSNPFLNVSVKRDGFNLHISKIYNKQQIYYEIRGSGKYDITISSKYNVNKQKKLTLYIDSCSADAAYERFFGKKVIYEGQEYGDSFIDYSPNNPYGNIRVFDEYSKIPVFLGTLKLKLNNPLYNGLSLYGVITNKTTGKSFLFNGCGLTLTDCGEYEVMFSTNAKYYDAVILGNKNVKMAGDVRVYKFNFKIISNDNHVNVNEKLLSTGKFKELSILSVSDYIPKYYGVTRQSSDKGEIIVAFSDRESALKYAKEVVWGKIETHTDSRGNKYWTIPNIDDPLGGKIISYSGWKNAQTIKALAEKMVVERYFDLTKPNSYITLEKCIEDFDKEGITFTDLQRELLVKSVVIWYSVEQRDLALVSNTEVDDIKVTKFIGNQKYSVLSKDDEGVYTKINNGEKDYYFVKDILGIDSYSITASDNEGNKFTLNYKDGLYAQLKEQCCAPGLVFITETNIYNKITAEYYIYFIPEDYQPVSLSLIADGQIIKFNKNNIPQTKSFNKISIADISGLVEPYSYVCVMNKSSNYSNYYSISDAIGIEITDHGFYELAIIDRFGNNLLYTFSIN